MIGWQSTFYTAKSLERLGKFKKAIDVYEKIPALLKNKNPKIHYSLGNCYYQNSQYGLAIRSIETAIRLDASVATWHYRLGFILEGRKEWSSALEQYLLAVDIENTRAPWQFRIARCHYALKNTTAGDQSLRTAIEIDPGTDKYYDVLARSLNQQGKSWQELEVLEKGFPHNKHYTDWEMRLALAYSSMNKPEESASIYESLRSKSTASPEALFLEGYQWSLAGNEEKATTCYKQAVAHQNNRKRAELGIGYFYESDGLWDAAIKAYRSRLVEYPANGDLHFRLARAYAKVGNYDDAISHYTNAKTENQITPNLFYQLGKIHEKTANYSAAANDYNWSSKVDGLQQKDAFYRLAVNLEKMGNHAEAIHEYKKYATMNQLDLIQFHAGAVAMTDALDNLGSKLSRLKETEHSLRNSKSWPDLYALALDFETIGDPSKARDYYHRAYMSSPGNNLKLIFRYAHSIEKTGNLEEACKIYSQMTAPQSLMMADTANYDYETVVGRNAFYAEAYDNFTLTNTVLYESNHGSNASCNPLAIYEAALEDPRLADFDHVWVVNDTSTLPNSIASNPRAHVIAKHSVQYRRQLASAKYLISNSTFPAYFIRKREQVYLNTWHGTPLKLMGSRVRQGDFEHRNVTRNLLQVSKLLAPNQHTLDCLIRDHQIEGIFSGEVAHIGTPRIDRTIRTSDAAREELYAKLGIDPNSKIPIVLYAPTWRGGLSSRQFDAARLLSDLTELSNMDVHLVFRAHHFAEAALEDTDLDAIVAPSNIDTNDLLSITDILITDYSSIFFDFVTTKRPIIFYAYDLEEYQRQRGLYFSLDDMPGTTVRDLPSLTKRLDSLIKSPMKPNSVYLDAISTFAPEEDGFAAKRALDFLLATPANPLPDNEYDSGKASKISILFYQGSFMPNGITTAFMSLVKSLDPEQYTITVVIEPDAVFGKPEHLDKYRQLPDYVRVVPRVGAQLRTADENEIIKRFNGPGNGIDATAQRGHEASYNREFSRIFGESHFDVIVDFEGYSSHWAAILGLSGRSKARHIIYLHNDMVAEWEMRFPSLSRTFELYKEFDALISVSKSVHQVNMSGLAARSGLPNSAFVWADNFVDVSQILQGGLDDVPNSLSHLFSESVTTFSTMGRLSPEKDHAKLIRAFALVHDEYPQTRLVILGDGPLRQTLNVQIAAAGLLDKVILVGLLENPFAIVKKSDCFVFSSNYEGQGLALVEALILGVPVVSTDVVGPRSVLEYGHGLLVENSIEGLVGGMRSYLSGAMNYPIFDPVDYQTRAAEQFKTAISHSQTNHV